MRLHIILRYVGFVCLLNALFLLIAAGISALNGDAALRPLVYSCFVVFLFGIFPLIFVPRATFITNNEGLIIVVFSWLLSCLIGTIPYVLWGGEFSFTNAWFESVSGYTTTGSTILTNIEAVPLGLLFWRSATHWIGGMGIIVFVLAVLPYMGVTSMILYRSEISPLARDNFQYNAQKTLKIVLSVYIGLTLLEAAALLVCGMNLFDAVTHAFGTIATGGFSPRNASVAYYGSVAVETVIMVFMVLSGMHFGLLYATVFERSRSIWKSTVVRYYLAALCIGVAVSTFDLTARHLYQFAGALRYAAFQIISIGTSTGFATADSSVWPVLTQVLLMFFALQCACAGSTSGGIKTDRICIMAKAFAKQIKMLRHPRAVIAVKMDGVSIPDDILAMSLLFILAYLSVVFLASLALIALGTDPVSSFSAVIATTGNVGPGLGTVGSSGNFNHLPGLGKWILSATMLMGRLEIYGLILFFQPYIWRKRSG